MSTWPSCSRSCVRCSAATPATAHRRQPNFTSDRRRSRSPITHRDDSGGPSAGGRSCKQTGQVGAQGALGNAEFPIHGTERGIRAGVQRSEIRPDLIASASSRSANKHFQSWSRRVAAAVCKSRRHVGLPASIAARSSRVRVPRLSGASRRQPLPRGAACTPGLVVPSKGTSGVVSARRRTRTRRSPWTRPSGSQWHPPGRFPRADRTSVGCPGRPATDRSDQRRCRPAPRCPR